MPRRVLLDECIDWRLAGYLQPYEVQSVAKAGWAGTTNGDLLRRAEKTFDVFVKVDRNLSFQQSVVDLDLAVIVICAKSNRLQDLTPLVPKILTALASATAGQGVFVSE